jgi:hypothetical protein
MMLLPANLTFKCEFTVTKSELRMQEEFGVPSEKLCWVGQGNGQADDQALQRNARYRAVLAARSPAERERDEAIAKYVRAGHRAGGSEGSPSDLSAEAEGLVGPKPRFELCAGWLTVLPTEGWTQPLPVRKFSDAAVRKPDPNDLDEVRSLKSFSLYVGEPLQNVVRPGDTLRFSHNEMGDFSYHLAKNCEMILSAGHELDEGGFMAVWQEYDSEVNPNARKSMHGFLTAERISVPRPYVSVRLNDQVFHLLEGQDAYVEPDYVFIARSNYSSEILDFIDGGGRRAVYSAGRIGEPRKELTKEIVKSAAHRLRAPATRTL